MLNPYQPPQQPTDADEGSSVDDDLERNRFRKRLIVTSCFCVSFFLGAVAFIYQSTPLVLLTLAISWIGLSFIDRPDSEDAKK